MGFSARGFRPRASRPWRSREPCHAPAAELSLPTDARKQFIPLHTEIPARRSQRGMSTNRPAAAGTSTSCAGYRAGFGRFGSPKTSKVGPLSTGENNGPGMVVFVIVSDRNQPAILTKLQPQPAGGRPLPETRRAPGIPERSNAKRTSRRNTGGSPTAMRSSS